MRIYQFLAVSWALSLCLLLSISFAAETDFVSVPYLHLKTEWRKTQSPDPAIKEETAKASVLFFSEDGSFSQFDGTLLRNIGEKEIILGTGSGYLISFGAWHQENDEIVATFRWVGLDKIVLEPMPEIPSGKWTAHISREKKSLVFDGKSYSPVVGFDKDSYSKHHEYAGKLDKLQK